MEKTKEQKMTPPPPPKYMLGDVLIFSPPCHCGDKDVIEVPCHYFQGKVISAEHTHLGWKYLIEVDSWIRNDKKETFVLEESQVAYKLINHNG